MRKYIQTSKALTELLTRTAELTRDNHELLTKLVPWLDAHNEEQRNFRNVVLIKLQRIEATVQLILVGQFAEHQSKKLWFTKERLKKDAANAEEFILKSVQEQSMSFMECIYGTKKDVPPPVAKHDRRRKWQGWEI